MNKKLRAALIGGVVIGLLSSIPYLRLINVACCLWVIVGSALAVYLYIKSSPVQVNAGEGALIGALSGALGMLVQIIIGVPLTILTGYPELNFLLGLIERVDPQKAEAYRQKMELALSRPFAEQFFASLFSWGTLISLLIIVVFALVGGLIAIPLFEKRKSDAAPPPPPPQFDGASSESLMPPASADNR